MVLEYDEKRGAPPPATPAPAGEDPATVERARQAYFEGNTHLFAGDAPGAVTGYRHALELSPATSPGTGASGWRSPSRARTRKRSRRSTPTCARCRTPRTQGSSATASRISPNFTRSETASVTARVQR